MRTLLFLASGLLLMAAALILGKLFSSNYPEATRVATIAYVPAAAAILVKWRLL